MTRSVRNRWLAVAVVVVAVGGGTAVWLQRDDHTGRAATVQTAEAGMGEVTASVGATGTVRASVTRSLGFGVDGTVVKVAVRAGSKVAVGAVLASVDATDAASAVDDAQDSLAAAQDQLSSAKTAAAAVGVRAAASGEPEVKADAARAVGGDAILSAQERVNQAVVALAEAREALAGVTLTAPISGTVMSVAGQVGSKVSRGSTFVTVADTNAMRVTADFPEADAGALVAGQEATVTLADRVGASYPATVTQVDPVGTSDGTLVTYGVLLALTKTPAGLLDGQTAGVVVRTGSVARTLRVPSTAVHDQTVLVRSGNSSSPRTVGVGLRGDQYTQITSGLTAGERVVQSW